jgi:septin family protein
MTEPRALPREGVRKQESPRRGVARTVLMCGNTGQGRNTMYNGTLIDDLIAAVEHTESSFRVDQERESKLAYWYAVAQGELANLHRQNHELAGVA